MGVGINKLGWSRGINWRDVEVNRGEMGEIRLSLTGRALTLAQQKGITDWQVSVSHMGDYATSTVAGIVKQK